MNSATPRPAARPRITRTGGLVVATVLLAASTAAAKIVDRIIAQVNDDIITLSDLNREMVGARQQLATQFSGPQLEAELKKAERETLDGLIRDKLILQKASELGFSANVDVQVTAALEKIRKDNNIKDMQDFERALAQQGMTLGGFRERLRRQIVIDGVIDSFVRSRITLLSAEIERYYRDHAADFTSIEEVTLSEILIPSADNPGAETRANDVRKRALAGENFGALVSQFSKGATADKGGGIGTYVLPKLGRAIASAIANLKEGEVSPVVSSKEGFAIYRVDNRKPAERMALDKVRPEIQQRIFMQKFSPELERFVAGLKEDAYIQIFGDLK